MSVWTSVSPDGTKSVKANTPTMDANTAYIDTQMNKDHFWNKGVNQDGRHQFVQSPAFVVGGNPADPPLATGMDGEIYFRTVSATNANIELFRCNASGIYQISPTLLQNSILIGSSYVTIATVPDNCYGQIYIIDPSGAGFCTSGFFVSNNGTAYAFVNTTVYSTSSTVTYAHKFNNTGAVGLNIQVHSNNAPTGTYTTKVLVWGT